MFKRFTPNQWKNYCNLLCLYRIYNHRVPENLWLELQINALPLTRSNKTLFPPKNKLKIGLNSFSNRLSYISTLINNDHLNLSYSSYKIKIKELVAMNK